MNAIVMTTSRPASASGDRNGGGCGVVPANASWRIASSPVASGIVASARAPSRPSAAIGKFSPDTK